MRVLLLGVLLAVAGTLAACGGGGGGSIRDGVAGGAGGNANGSDVPSSALSSSDALIAFMRQLIESNTSDTTEPLALGNVTLPVSDTTEPASLN